MHVQVRLTLTEAEEITRAIPVWVADAKIRRGPHRARVLLRALDKIHLAMGTLAAWRSAWPREEEVQS